MIHSAITFYENSSFYKKRLDLRIQSVKKIFDAIYRKDYVDAGIRISQAGLDDFFPNFRALASPLKKFDPSEPRDERGRWTGGNENRAQKPQRTAIVDPYCKIVKQLCIVEATEKLPTKNFGASFQIALNNCMDRHGCLGRA